MRFTQIRTKRLSLLIIFSIQLLQVGAESKEPIDYVNPFIGNISHLLVPTYPTVHLPNSMLRVYPERNDFTSDMLNGLPVVVTSHRGNSAFNISPVQGTLAGVKPVTSYSYDQEKITPYRYSVYLDDVDINVDYSLSHQSGIYSFTFGKNEDNFIVLNVGNGVLQQESRGVAGYQYIGDSQTRIYLYLETEEQPETVGALINDEVSFKTQHVEGRNKAIVMRFNRSQKRIGLRYGISFISTEQARKNLRREIKTYNIDQIAEEGRKIWNNTLSKILIKGSSENEKVVFYTSLYRTYERMINISEDGRYYSASDGKIHEDEGYSFYTDDWVWDTYRATHPLRTLIEPEMETNMIRSYIRMSQQSTDGWMPTFPEVTGDSHRMNGNHAVAVIADAYAKGLHNFDLQAAYKACKAALTEKSLLPWTKQPLSKLDTFYLEKGYFPALNPGEKEYCSAVHGWERRQAVAITLAACYDNWCLSQLAKALGNNQDVSCFEKRSLNYRNLFNDKTSFFHPKNAQGDFIQPFDYRFSGGAGARDYYDENNGWTYRWDLQHNIGDLVKLMGGPDKFIQNLDQTFREPLGMGRSEFYSFMGDNTANVGQFTMANEPSLHIPYLYNYAGQPWKTQKRIRTLLKEWFRNDLMGIPGDEDGGGMTAFVVFSSMGFYPVTPGSPTYNIGSPLFETVKLKLGNGKVFEIVSKNYSTENKYIQSATLNNKPWNKPWFSQNDIAGGGKLVLVMGDKPNKAWGNDLKDVPPSANLLE